MCPTICTSCTVCYNNVAMLNILCVCICMHVCVRGWRFALKEIVSIIRGQHCLMCCWCSLPLYQVSVDVVLLLVIGTMLQLQAEPTHLHKCIKYVPYYLHMHTCVVYTLKGYPLITANGIGWSSSTGRELFQLYMHSDISHWPGMGLRPDNCGHSHDMSQ